MANFSIFNPLFVVTYYLLISLQSSTETSQYHDIHYDDEEVYQYSHHVQWSCFNSTISAEAINCCQMLASSPIVCLENGPSLKLGYCATYDQNNSKSLSVTECQFFHMHSYNVTDPGYILLPKSLTELNDYMCGPLNRKGLVCSECIDGFGPSVTSFGNVCTNCTGTWYYRLTLILLIELVPITVFYLLILVFRVRVTKPPMPCFVMYAQLIVVAFDLYGYTSLKDIIFNDGHIKLDMKIFHTFYFVFNLDIFRHIIPPICVSSEFKFIHLAFLGYISAFYPILLIIFTWLCVELHDRNVRALVMIWRPFHKCFVHLRKGWDTKNDMIDVFITFFLLSYTKCSYQALRLLSGQQVFHYHQSDYGAASFVSSVDLSINVFGNTHLSIAIPAMLIFFVFNLLPPLLLTLYPIKCFRFRLSKCCIN